METDTLKVTVVTMTYNNFGNLFRTIKSVLNQRYNKIEYIISDDGSKNFPIADIKKFIDSNNTHRFEIKILANEHNQGTVKNINGAYRKATGKYIVNLSCGDIFFNDYVIEKIVDRFEKSLADVIAT